MGAPRTRPRLKKALGQHHLIDGALCRPALEFLAEQAPLAGREVLEIGPGGGVLTERLLAAGARVTAWELDGEWIGELLRRLAPSSAETSHLTVVEGDALDIPWGRLPPGTLAAGNLPYQVSTALIRRLLPHGRRVPRAAFLVQWEVAQRLLAGPGEEAYGALSVLVAAQAEVRLLSRVRRGSFRPPPKVEGAFVGLTLRPPPLLAEEMPAFTDLVHLAFGQRRKQLRNALAAGWGREGAQAALAAAGISPDLRAEQLSLEDFLRLHRARRQLTRREP